jgi:hypothetical protein
MGHCDCEIVMNLWLLCLPEGDADTDETEDDNDDDIETPAGSVPQFGRLETPERADDLQ